MSEPSPFPPKPGPPAEPPRHSRGFPGPVPRLEGPIASLTRLVWNLLLSAVLGIMIGAFGSALLHQFIVALTGPLGEVAQTALSIAGWAAGLFSTFVLFMSYYLDDSQQ